MRIGGTDYVKSHLVVRLVRKGVIPDRREVTHQGYSHKLTPLDERVVQLYGRLSHEGLLGHDVIDAMCRHISYFHFRGDLDGYGTDYVLYVSTDTQPVSLWATIDEALRYYNICKSDRPVGVFALERY